MPDPDPALVLINLPELAGKPPTWPEVQASFLNKETNVIVRTVALLLIGQMASARRRKESDPTLPADQSKFADGSASVADETLSWILKLIRGEGDNLPASVKRLFPDPKKESSSNKS